MLGIQLRAERAWSIRGKIAFIGMCRTWLAVNLTVKERIIFITRGLIVDEMKKFFEYRQKKNLIFSGRLAKYKTHGFYRFLVGV